MLGEFKKFALKGNVLDLAVGLIIGTAFTTIVNSLVNDMLMPPIGLIIGKVDFSNLFFTLSGMNFNTLSEAKSGGAVTLNYGMFINTIVNFLIIAFAVFLLVKQVNKLRDKFSTETLQVPVTKPCPYCCSEISIKATRCPHCTSELIS